jgi:DNA-binding CsgD family transcriptional regulator
LAVISTCTNKPSIPVFTVTAGVGFASTNIADATLARASRVTPAVTAAQAALSDAMSARDRECKGGVGKFCRERETAVNERRQALDAATPQGRIDRMHVDTERLLEPSDYERFLLQGMCEAYARAGFSHLPAPALPHALTRREVECLRWIAVGRSDPQIGMLLGLSPNTVHAVRSRN